MSQHQASCHCGAIELSFTLSRPAADYQPRACDCDFCRRHGAAYISDPAGSLAIRYAGAAVLGRYRQGSGTADCLVCRECGVLVGAIYEDGESRYGTLNRRILLEDPGFGAEVVASPKVLDAGAKVTRWRDVWFAGVDLSPKTD